MKFKKRRRPVSHNLMYFKSHLQYNARNVLNKSLEKLYLRPKNKQTFKFTKRNNNNVFKKQKFLKRQRTLK